MRARAGAVAFVLAAVLLAASPAAAQAPAPPSSFAACVTTIVDAVQAGGPAPTDRGFFETPDNLLGAVWLCAGQFANDTMVPIGDALLAGLAIIAVIWAGVGFMFSGRFDFGSLLGTVFLAGLAFMLLDNYFTATPALWPGGTTRGVVGLFAEEAVFLSETVIGDTDRNFGGAYGQARAAAADDVRAEEAAEALRRQELLEGIQQPFGEEFTLGELFSLDGLWRSMLSVPLSWVRGTAAFVLWLVGWILYAQYVWGFFTLTVLTVLGPVLIPWMLIPQLDFLFWGWVKAMINGVVYMLTAAALYAVTASILLVPLDRIAQMPMPSWTNPAAMVGAGEVVLRLLVEWIPLTVMVLLASFRVGPFAAGIVSGGSMPGAGLGSMMSKAAAGAQTYKSWRGAGPASGGAAGGGEPLSVETGRQRAYEEARRRSGGGGLKGKGGRRK